VRFAEAEGITIISEYVEAETAAESDAFDRRPLLAASLQPPNPPSAASWFRAEL
jgi:hypothetical protein